MKMCQSDTIRNYHAGILVIRFARYNCLMWLNEEKTESRRDGKDKAADEVPRPRERKEAALLLTWYGNGDLQEKCGPKSERLGRQKEFNKRLVNDRDGGSSERERTGSRRRHARKHFYELAGGGDGGPAQNLSRSPK